MVMRALTGWGRATSSVAEVRVTRSVDDVQSAVLDARERGSRGVLARGLGRSYGDAAQNAGGVVLDLAPLADIAVDGDVVRLGPGAVLHDVMRALLPRGLFVPVTPGTRQVTAGGLLAADVHGKNHHRDGSWGNHVTEISLVTASGDVRTLHPDGPEAAAFWATVGGMGLTGVVVQQKVRAIPVDTAWMAVTTRAYPNLVELMEAMRAADADAPYSVAWVDSVGATGDLGRGIVSTGRHARLDEIPARARRDPLAVPRHAMLATPAVVPGGLLRPLTVGAFNDLWWRVSGRPASDAPQHISGFFHPLDAVRDWNRIYGRAGMVQYQFVVPDDAADVVAHVLAALRDAQAPSFLSVLKRFGPGNAAPLSFPTTGWTLALDLPAGNPRLAATLEGLDRAVIECGGRFYLAKDARMSQRTFAAGYPRLDQWRAARNRLDPDGIFISDLARRLGVTARRDTTVGG